MRFVVNKVDRMTLIPCTLGGNILVDDEENILCQKSDGTFAYASADCQLSKDVLEISDNPEYLATLGITQRESEATSPITFGEGLPSCSHNTISSIQTECVTEQPRKAKWLRKSILALIESYKEKKNFSKSSAVTAEDVWEEIGKLMKEKGFYFTPVQCRNKFASLKVLYCKAVDLNKSTGGVPHNFAYYEQFNEIFGKDHFIRPSALASSSKGCEISAETPMEREDISITISGNGKKRNYSATSELLSFLKMKEEKREEEKKEKAKRRKEEVEMRKKEHEDRMSVAREATDTFRTMMEKLIQKI